jgi:hypothetical protein
VAEERSYRLEPLDTSGVFLGLGVAQCALLGVGLLLGVIAVSVGAPVPAAVLPVVAAGVASFARVGGHPLWEWLALGVGWIAAGLAHRRRWDAVLPLWPVDADRPPPLPPCLAGLEIVELHGQPDRAFGAVHDGQRHTLTAVVPVRAGAFVVEPRAEQERLLAGWGDVLGQFAAEQGTVAHLCWSALTRPSGGLDDHTAWLTAAPRDGQGDTNPAAAASYDRLLDVAAGSAATHDVVVAVTVGTRGERRRGPRPAGTSDRLGQALASAVEALRRSLASAGLDSDDPLDGAGLSRLLRARVAPIPTAPRGAAGGRLAERLGLVTPASAGPLVVELGWRRVRVDGLWHRTWWVACWPRLAVPPSWLEPFLSTAGVCRTMTVWFVPTSTHRSRRRIQRDLVKLESDAAVRHEKGRRVDARHRRATEALLDREAELVAGYAETPYMGLVSVVATSEEDLDDHAAVVEQLALEAGMELRVLDGRQDVAWAATLPFGLAPATLSGT